MSHSHLQIAVSCRQSGISCPDLSALEAWRASKATDVSLASELLNGDMAPLQPETAGCLGQSFFAECSLAHCQAD